MTKVLDNPYWYALNTVHAPYAEVNGRARRYDPEVAMMGAAEELDDDVWREFELLAGPKAAILFARAKGVRPPERWVPLFSAGGLQMILDQPREVEAPDGTRPLTAADVPAMMELVALTEPGPFGPRTIELGGYLGIFDEGRLLAMAGQRLSTDDYTEISAVCTHPEARRRGYAAALTLLVASGIAAAGGTPILHVADFNTSAQRLYAALGFRTRTMLAFRAFLTPAMS
jgi:GNAT superfamily N-acetyltransferase